MTITTSAVAPVPFQVEVTGSAPVRTVLVTGEVDTVTAPALRAALESVAGEGTSTEVVVDLCRVTFLDSAGLCALAAAARVADDAGAGIRVRCATRGVVRVLQLTGLWESLNAELVGS
ncbi:anti-sigma factor antagonist [Modestobacter sp. I12A-02628]|uniref:Anti-sigma factor antagonist n=1 Tax=Goekera deserti TaxID=2497753 RepID=A0A7K3WID1_9ACTN|nr:STAS domain-containing protein [Goekera deserti]MPQ96416.1 anti-sigma factor antagonist [Goekera deserti]NDI47272.1 anti-sigma factor antagonist [Goekera deserti]NEL56102.1 STAS domain-containing protein [Goekera deserti]